MSYTTDIRAAVRAHLLAIPELPAAKAWEGRAFTPVVGTPYMRESLLPAGRTAASIGSVTVGHIDLVQIDLFYPFGTELNAMKSMADVLADIHFRPGTPLAYGPSMAVVMKAERNKPLYSAEWAQSPVSLTLEGRS